jgi:segregation and condensation protein A
MRYAGIQGAAMKDYRVRLEAFEGPLDLLLFLIRQHEVEITDIPIATIADQYLAFLQQAGTAGAGGFEHIDIDVAGEFLVMAATLMEIKSRMLAPSPDGSAEDAGSSDPSGELDPRADLVRQLLAYKRFRDAADELERRREDWERRYPSMPAAIREDDQQRLAGVLADESLEMDDLSISDLLDSFQRIVATVNFDRLGEHTVVVDDTPIEIHAEDILERLRSGGVESAWMTIGENEGQGTESEGAGSEGLGGETIGARHTRPTITLRAMLQGRTRGEMLGLFLAMLELVRRRLIAIRQRHGEGGQASERGGEIEIGLLEASETGVDPATTAKA